MLVTVIDVVGAQCSIQMVHQRNIGGVVQRCTFRQQAGGRQNLLSLFVAIFRQEDLVALFVHRKVAWLGDALACPWVSLAFLSHQLGGQLIDGLVHRRVVVGLTRNDQRRARLINQNRVHFVNNRKVQATLNAVCCVIHHVVAQIVKPVLVVGAVCNVSQIRQLLFIARGLGQVHTHRQAQEVVQRAHGFGVTTGQVVIHSHHMHALACQGVQVHRQRRGQRLTLTRTHFRNLALVQRNTTHQLHVKVTHLQNTL